MMFKLKPGWPSLEDCVARAWGKGAGYAQV
jgi:hypothetical protein